MTDMQIRYQQLMESKRSNLANEAIKGKSVESEVSLNAQREKQILSEIDKIAAQIENINADTSLAPYKKAEAISKIFSNFAKGVSDATKAGVTASTALFG